MRVRIHPQAAAYRVALVVCGRPPTDSAWLAIIAKVEGTWIDVEVEHLFQDQFNTAPIPGVCDTGLRLMAHDVCEVEGDVRPGRMRCGWCGLCAPAAKACPRCGNEDLIQRFVHAWSEAQPGERVAVIAPPRSA